MYNEKQMKAQTAIGLPSEETFLEMVSRRIDEIGSLNSDYLNKIETKLHTVINLVKPETVSEISAMSTIPKIDMIAHDYSKELIKKLDFLQTQSERIKDCVIHLNKII